jgi:hypothetical protein
MKTFKPWCVAIALFTASPAFGMRYTVEIDGELPAFLKDDEAEIRVIQSPGGSGAAAMALARHPVKVDGPCNSACAWSFVINERACFTAKASFGFHAAYDPGTGTTMPTVTAYWIDQATPSLSELIANRIGKTGIVTLSAIQMKAHYPERACK